MYLMIKVLVSAFLIVLISEIAKRSSLLGAVLASVPLVSVLGIIWLYLDTGDTERVAALANDIFWLVIPSLALFIALPLMLRAGWNFWFSLGSGVVLTAAAYGATLWLLRLWPVWTRGAWQCELRHILKNKIRTYRKMAVETLEFAELHVQQVSPNGLFVMTAAENAFAAHVSPTQAPITGAIESISPISFSVAPSSVALRA